MNSYLALLAILEHGSFTKAAETLGYTQSAISQLIQTLEKELNTKLIIRSRSGVKLTPDGEQLIPYIKNICLAYKELEDKKNAMQGLGSDIIRIGAFSSICFFHLPNWIKTFKTLYPSLKFEVKIGDYSEIEQMIIDGTVDFGFVNPRVVKDLTTTPIMQDEVFVCLYKQHPLINRTSISLNELINEPFVLMEEGTDSEVIQLFKEHDISPNVQFIVQGDYPVLSMIEQGLGISVIPSLMLHRIDETIIRVPLEPKRFRTISLAYKDPSILPIASRTFLQFIKKQVSNEIKKGM